MLDAVSEQHQPSVLLVAGEEVSLRLRRSLSAAHSRSSASDDGGAAAGGAVVATALLAEHSVAASLSGDELPSAVIEPARSARFSSGLSVMEFVKRTSILKCGPDQLRALGPAAIALAEAEGLAGHGRAVSIRLNM